MHPSIISSACNHEERERQIWESGRQAGYTAGYADGKQHGFTKGFDQGTSEGKNKGYAEGKSDGFVEGYRAGLAEVYPVKFPRLMKWLTIAFRSLPHALLGLTFVLYACYLVYITWSPNNLAERFIRSMAVSLAIGTSYAAKGLGVSLSDFLAKPLMLSSPALFLMGLLVPSLIGAILAWYLIRAVNRGTLVAMRLLLLFGTLAVFEFAKLYAGALGEEGLAADVAFLPNLMFILAAHLYVILTFQSERLAASRPWPFWRRRAAQSSASA
jgi:hypothetical protein